jgi:hypothetical protein
VLFITWYTVPKTRVRFFSPPLATDPNGLKTCACLLRLEHTWI